MSHGGWEISFGGVVKESPERGGLGLLAIKTIVSTNLAKAVYLPWETPGCPAGMHKDKNRKAEGLVGMLGFVGQCWRQTQVLHTPIIHSEIHPLSTQNRSGKDHKNRDFCVDKGPSLERINC